MAYTTPAQLAKQLAYRDTADPRLDQICEDAADEIDHECGRHERFPDPVPATVANVSLSLCVDIWKQPDATFGVMGLAETGMVRTPRDLIERYRPALIGFYERATEGVPGGWGVA